MKIYGILLSLCLGVVACSGNKADTSDSGTTTPSVTSNTCYRSSTDTAYIISCTPSFTGVPAWISSNFTCGTVTVSGGNYVFSTTSAPTHKSKYWGSGSPNFENAMPSGTSANPNTISAQNYVLNIPTAPALTATPTASGYDIVGVAANGVAIFNNQAAPGDSLASELATMDYGNGHPTGPGVYHYHIEPCYISNNDNSFVGLMRDGYPIFGRTEPVTGVAPAYVDSCTYTNATSVANCRPYPTQMPNFHCHSIAGWTGPACHYHVTTTDPFIIEYYAGTAGTFTN